MPRVLSWTWNVRSRAELMARGETAEASENDRPLLCTRVTRRSPIRPERTIGKGAS